MDKIQGRRPFIIIEDDVDNTKPTTEYGRMYIDKLGRVVELIHLNDPMIVGCSARCVKCVYRSRLREMLKGECRYYLDGPEEERMCGHGRFVEVDYE